MTNPPSAIASRVLTGSQARRWMAGQGWVVEGNQTFHVSAESVGDQSFSISRIWHSSALLHRAASSKGGLLLVLIAVDGTGTVRLEGHDAGLGARQIVFADADKPLDVSFDEASARLEVVVDRQRLGVAERLLRRNVEILTIHESYWRTLAALIVTILGTGIRAQDAGFVSLKSAVESAISAALLQSPLEGPAAGSYSPLLVRAQSIIEERFADRQFSTTELARSLAISPAHLHRTFSSVAATPYQVIQQRRANQAADLIRSHVEESAAAAQTGFSSPRAMRRALRKHGKLGESL